MEKKKSMIAFGTHAKGVIVMETSTDIRHNHSKRKKKTQFVVLNTAENALEQNMIKNIVCFVFVCVYIFSVVVDRSVCVQFVHDENHLAITKEVETEQINK